MTETAKDQLFEYLLRLGDSSLILGQRLSEWCGHGPELEEDIALINVALDLIGQARSLLTYAGEVEGRGRDEDALAFLRDGTDYRNLLLVEQPNQDFAYTIARQFLFDAFHLELQQALTGSRDARLAAIAGKSVKEVTYHLRHSSEWLIRLGDGTPLSHDKMQTALDDLWMYSGEMFEMDGLETALAEAGVAPDRTALRPAWEARMAAVIEEATLQRPDDGWMQSGGLRGRHSEHLGHILAEMQHLQRAHPGAAW
ncbi:MAG: phenylacetate-CoA oxygenase subunit PaaC [Kiloniellales bacterium]|nr:phenylacetate-CoA oxygenase subunit PaaC [Kiloniellales bacterium]